MLTSCSNGIISSTTGVEVPQLQRFLHHAHGKVAAMAPLRPSLQAP